MVSDALVGSDVGDFRIERRLASSGSGDVYLAYDLRLMRKVALKVLTPTLAEDPAFRERFFRSSLATAALEHPNVIPVYDVGEADGGVYMAMRYIAGGSLRERLREGPLEPGEALALMRQVAAALDAAHARRLVHRDVKPENVLVDSTGTAYLVDFFVAVLSAEDAESTNVGSLPYMAPELCRGEEVDERADLYALGCMLFECLAGTPPYGGEGVATLEAHAHHAVPKISLIRPDLPHSLDTVFENALAKDRSARYESATVLVDALAGALGRRGVPVESGIVTFMFTDIEGSTRLLRQLRNRYPELVAEQQRLLRGAFAHHGGTEVDTQGESTFVAFRTATEAVLSAIRAQSALAGHSWPDGVELGVRIGIHTGTASRAGERYFGLAVHRAARICAFARGGQTVVSETTRSLFEDEENLPGVALRDLGLQTLKDFDRPVRLHEALVAL
jgi:class 3 adenylate cyclase